MIGCPIHPTYRGIRAPRSKAKGCQCRFIYFVRQTAKEVAKWPDWMRGGVGS